VTLGRRPVGLRAESIWRQQKPPSKRIDILESRGPGVDYVRLTEEPWLRGAVMSVGCVLKDLAGGDVGAGLRLADNDVGAVDR